MEISPKIKPGKPEPLGCSRTPAGINFAVFSEHADSMQLVLFLTETANPSHILSFDAHKNRTGHIWHIELTGLPAYFEYGFRAAKHKPHEPFDQYNPHLILNDPYARAYAGGEIFGNITPHLPQHCSRRSVFYEDDFDWEDDQPPGIPLADSIIYELHVRGFTRHESAQVSAAGTFKGLIEKIPYLQDLGITAVEFLPITEFDENLVTFKNPQTGDRLYNFWGYDPLGYFAPNASYALDNQNGQQIIEFKQLVKSLHRAGIEVILDVVFNHTGEGSLHKPTFSFRGLDNRVYYMIDRISGQYLNFTGCGNTVNCNHPVVSQMIIDALRYWVREMHVDGFRFDLASILCRDENGAAMENPPVLKMIKRDALLSKVKLIAEAWDAAGLYLVGSFPGGEVWAEWNDKYRDTLRRYIRGDDGMVPDLATRIAGSADLYQSSQRAPYHSINFITSHDGFTMMDLVSYNKKHNLLNGENNGDGLNENFSSNQGIEGETKDPQVNQQRCRLIKNMATLLMLSQGVPMIVAGDEFGRTQRGNNNAYCQDNEISWLNWQLLKQNKQLYRFFKHLIRFRKDHPVLRRRTFFDQHAADEIEVRWYNQKLQQPEWNKNIHSLAFHLLPLPGDCDIFVISSSSKRSMTFLLPELKNGKKWNLVLDTSRHSPDDFYPPGSELLLTKQDSYLTKRFSTVVLISK